MRTLLIPATALTLVCSCMAFAQTAPDASTATMPDAGMATDTPAATGTTAPAKPVHHSHHMARQAASDGGETFAHEPGTGQSGPASMKASNNDQADTHSAIAPHLPEPAGGKNAGWRNYLRDAERAIDMHKTGLAQQSLEMAETRLLDRSSPVDAAGHPSSSPVIQRVAEARSDLASGKLAAAKGAITMALTNAPAGDESGEGAMTNPGMAPPDGSPAGAK